VRSRSSWGHSCLLQSDFETYDRPSYIHVRVSWGVLVTLSWQPLLRITRFWHPRRRSILPSTQGTNVLLGPGTNLNRVPWNGRNFEYLGEDPVLASAMIFHEIKGIQVRRRRVRQGRRTARRRMLWH
jgi:hypothetical protein